MKFTVTLAGLAIALVIAQPQPTAAQIDFDIAGAWDQPALGTVLGPGVVAAGGSVEDADERANGPGLVNYAGIPLTDEGRARALAYDAALLGVPEHVCMRHPSTKGPSSLRR